MNHSVVYETAPIHLRGPLGGLTQLSIFSGALLCFTLGLGTPESVEDKRNSNYWRFMFALPGVIAILQTCLLMTPGFRHETPQFSLLKVDNELDARRVLGRK